MKTFGLRTRWVLVVASTLIALLAFGGVVAGAEAHGERINPAGVGTIVVPTGTLEVSVVNTDTFGVVATGSYSNSVDWGSCLHWGHDDGSHKCFPGFSGTFSEAHVMPGYGVYTVTLVVSGGQGGLYETWETVEFPLPPVVTPTCQIRVELIDLPSREISASVAYTGGAPGVWHFLWFGDELVPGPGSVGWQGTDGIAGPYPHQYDQDGEYELRAAIYGGYPGACTATVSIRQPEPPASHTLQLPWVGRGFRAGRGCTIQNRVGADPHEYTTTLSWWGAPAQWHTFFWGDGQSVGFLGSIGSQSWTHVYNPGSYHQVAVFSDGTEACGATVTVP